MYCVCGRREVEPGALDVDSNSITTVQIGNEMENGES